MPVLETGSIYLPVGRVSVGGSLDEPIGSFSMDRKASLECARHREPADWKAMMFNPGSGRQQ